MMLEKTFRIGLGYDIHRLIEGRELIIGGVKITHEKVYRYHPVQQPRVMHLLLREPTHPHQSDPVNPYHMEYRHRQEQACDFPQAYARRNRDLFSYLILPSYQCFGN